MPRRGECIYKRKDGRWEARFVKQITPDGKKKYGSVYADSYKGVKDKQQYYMYSAEMSSVKISGSRTLSELMDIWLMHIRPTVKAATYQKYEGLIRNHIKPEIGHITLRLVTRGMLDRFAQSQTTNGKIGGGGLSVKTVNDILIVLGMALRVAEEEYSTALPRITFLREETHEARVLSLDEEKVLLNALLSKIDIYKFGVLLSLYTGVRIGELCALEWSDVTNDAINVTKTVQRLKRGGKTELVVGQPKSRSSNRKIPIPEFLLPFIEQFRKPCGYVLQTRNGTCIEPRTLQHKFKTIIKSCGLSDVNFHALRHTFATRCVEAGFDVKTLSEILGHSDVKTTLNRYVHSSFDFKQINMQKLSMPLDRVI